MDHHELRAMPSAIITIELGQSDAGSIPVLVGVVPTRNLDCTGVFIDLRRSARHPSLRWTMLDVLPVRLIGQGAAPLPARARAGPARAGERSRHSAATLLARCDLSSQIAHAVNLVVGEPESFLAELALPPTAPAGESWYVCGRFGARLGPDLRSPWRLLEPG